MKSLKIPTLALVVFAAGLLQAKEVFVDCNKTTDDGDGLTEATAKRTIQAAVDAAAAGDTVTVLPGTYDQGGKSVDFACTQPGYEGETIACLNRVWISKALTLRAKSSDPDDTHIVGAWDPNPTSDMGTGPAAVRCVMVDTSEKVIVRGFTIRDGSSQDDETRVLNDYWPTAAGGVARSAVANVNFYVVDCVIRHCGGRRGAGVRGGWTIRCRVSDCYGASVQDGTTLHSAVTTQRRSRLGTYILSNVNAYNCTVMWNDGRSSDGARYFSDGGALYNTLVFGCVAFTYSAGPVSTVRCVTDSAQDGAGTHENSSFSQSDAFYMFKSPLDGDWSVRGDSAFVGLGDAALVAALDLPDEVEKLKDLDGNVLPPSGVIVPGCTQSTFTPVCGAICLGDKRIVVDGTRSAPAAGAYFYADSEFAQHKLTVELSAGEYLHSWNSIFNNRRRFPMLDNSRWVMPPSNVATRLSNTPQTTTQAFWVDPATGSDANDGSEAHPFATLSNATVVAKATAVASKNNYVVIFAASGEYGAAEGSVEAAGMQSRVYDRDVSVRIIGAGAYGEGKSVIVGQADPAATGTDYGRGTNAIRCAALNKLNSCIQGFELKDGRCKAIGTNTSADRGGGCHAGILTDCHIVNCGAGRGQVGYDVYLERCRITKPDPVTNGSRVLEGDSIAVACILEDQVGTQLNYTYTDGGYYEQCTFYPNPACRLIGSGARIFNCVTTQTPAPTSSWNFNVQGLVGLTGTPVSKDGHLQDVLNADPQFVDYLNGDYRLRSDSPAVGYGTLKSVADVENAGSYWMCYSPDIEGRKILFFDGKPLPGAVQELVQVVTVADAPYATVAPAAGDYLLEAGQTIAITYSNPTRPLIGVAAGTVTNEGNTCSYTATEICLGTVAVAPLFGTNWYVNAAKPDDAGDGFTPGTAKKTLVGIYGCDVLAGDVIHAAAGDYNEGTTTSKAGAQTLERVDMKAGTTLVADEGPAVTFISGADAPEGSRETYGHCDTLGIGATRAVCMRENTVLRGFTIRNGRTRGDSGTASDTDRYAGGVLARGGTSSLIEDCIVYSNAARRAGGGAGGTWRRCRFLWNMNDVLNSYQAFGGCYSCYFDYNDSYVASFPLVNCYLGPHKASWATGSMYSLYISPGSLVLNTICHQTVRLTSGGTGTVVAPTNCVFASWTVGSEAGADKSFDTTLIIQKTSAEINAQIDADTLTVTNRGFLVDAGHALAQTMSRLGDKGIDGGQRVYNGKIDIGPGEYDWRGIFGAAIGLPGAVDFASADVTLNEQGKVRLPDGASMSLDVSNDAVHGLAFDVSEGSLALRGGKEDAVLTASGVYKFTPPTVLSLAFAGVAEPSSAPYADIVDRLVKPVFMLFIR